MGLWPELSKDKGYVTTVDVNAHILEKQKQEQMETLELFQDAARGKVVANDNRGFFKTVNRFFGITL